MDFESLLFVNKRKNTKYMTLNLNENNEEECNMLTYDNRNFTNENEDNSSELCSLDLYAFTHSSENLSMSDILLCLHLNTSVSREEIINNILNNKYTDTETILYCWVLFRVVIYNDHIVTQNKKDLILEKLQTSILNINNPTLCGLYLKFTDQYILHKLCEYYYVNRFNINNKKLFILQMINDEILFETRYDEIKQHFINWFNNTTVYKQRCELIDILLKHAPNDEIVRNLFEQLRQYNNMHTHTQQTHPKTIYADTQNVHVHEIHSNTIKKGAQLILDVSKYDVSKYPPINIYEYLKENDLYNNTVQSVLYRIELDISVFIHKDEHNNENKFTAFSLFSAIIKYIAYSEYKSELHNRFLEECRDMKGFCISGHITRLMNILRGFDDKYDININNMDQLYSVISQLISNAFNNNQIDDNIVQGTYDNDFSQYYLEFVKNVINSKLEMLCNDYEYDNIKKNILSVCEKVTKHKWEFINDETLEISFVA